MQLFSLDILFNFDLSLCFVPKHMLRRRGFCFYFLLLSLINMKIFKFLLTYRIIDVRSVKCYRYVDISIYMKQGGIDNMTNVLVDCFLRY